MINQEVSDLFWLVSVVEAGSFSVCAEKHGISKSVISKYINRLEQELGVKLLMRTTRKLSLTEAGKLVYQRAQGMQDEMKQIRQLAYEHQNDAQGTIKINAPFSFGQHQLMPAITKFMQLYPLIKIECLLGSYLSGLIHDGFDAVIYLKEPPVDNIIAKRISSHRMHICATPQYLQRHGTPLTLDDLLAHNCLVYKSLDHLHPWHVINAAQKKVALQVHGNLTANSSQALLTAVLNSAGLAMLSDHLVGQHLKSKKLISVLENFCPQKNIIYIARAPSAYLPQKTRLLIDFLADYFETK